MITRFSILAATAFLSASAAAQAGGYIAPTEAAAPLPAPAAPAASSWEGGYVGATLGYGLGGDDRAGIGLGQQRTLTTPDSLEINGVNMGLRAGYRWERPVKERSIVFGLELGIEGGNLGDSFSTAGYDANVDVNHVIALRAKTGTPVGDGNTLVYGIAGLAQGDFDYSIKGNGAAGPVNISDSFTHSGYIVGLGVERKLRGNLSVTGEWEYANFGKTHLEDAAGKSTEATPDYHNLKIGVNYKF